MKIKELIPWNSPKNNGIFRSDMDRSLFAMQKEMNRMFDAFSRSLFDFTPMSRDMSLHKSITPKVDVVETNKDVRVTAELPGMEEKDIEVNLSRDTLVIKGEKKAEVEGKKENCYMMERAYGAFQRVISVSPEIDKDKVEAKFKNGVLTVTLPKSEEAQKEVKKVAISCE